MKDLQRKYNSYKKKSHDNLGIGHFYERQIRYLYETKGWRVEPYGILKGKNDLGRDLICTKKKTSFDYSSKKLVSYKQKNNLSKTFNAVSRFNFALYKSKSKA